MNSPWPSAGRNGACSYCREIDAPDYLSTWYPKRAAERLYRPGPGFTAAPGSRVLADLVELTGDLATAETATNRGLVASHTESC